MVATFLALLALSAPPEVVGVVRGGASVRPASGLLRAGDRIRTDESGWADLHVLGRGRVRLFPRTEVGIDSGPTLRVIKGRLWMQAFKKTSLVLRGAQGHLDSRTSAIVEDTRSGGLVVAVRAGQAGVGSVEIQEGTVWRRPTLGPALEPSRGGDQLADLLQQQVDRLLGDASGLQDWLLAELKQARIARPRGLSTSGIIRSEQEAAAASSSGVLTEAALRPPPFFEDEIPPRGPNIRLEIDFSDD